MKIKLVRPYAHHRRGEVLKAGRDVAFGVAEALCQPSEDGKAYAVEVTPDKKSDDEDSNSGDTE